MSYSVSDNLELELQTVRKQWIELSAQLRQTYCQHEFDYLHLRVESLDLQMQSLRKQMQGIANG